MDTYNAKYFKDLKRGKRNKKIVSWSLVSASAIVSASLVIYQGLALDADLRLLNSSLNGAYESENTKLGIYTLLEEKPLRLKINANEAMLRAIRQASIEFNVPEMLIIGIANAESGLGRNFYKESDKACNNWWGLKGGNMELRKDGSYLRCFGNELSGARTVAKTLRLYYLDEGKDTPEKIANKWVGKNQSEYHEIWIKNVRKFYN